MLGKDNRGTVMEKIKEHKYCLRCGRLLIKQENKERGYGDICWKKSHVDKRKKKLWGE